jgi:hypothetical protein
MQEDNYSQWKRHDDREQAALDRLPVCEYCGEPLTDEFCCEYGGDVICEECNRREFRRYVEELIFS